MYLFTKFNHLVIDLSIIRYTGMLSFKQCMLGQLLKLTLNRLEKNSAVYNYIGKLKIEKK
ncbi:hypothetical protein BpHYR1_028636 [Brachionus plicatilis]|uniref:Uncharacterized protein n=1 Tax=Brachionus plicatilis TaxID=10195 RepID=A0A3M7RDF7_BRAPC|nr:hypothetical protein BpHYR1_028636 [Brachionus plicatilis]